MHCGTHRIVAHNGTRHYTVHTAATQPHSNLRHSPDQCRPDCKLHTLRGPHVCRSQIHLDHQAVRPREEEARNLCTPPVSRHSVRLAVAVRLLVSPVLSVSVVVRSVPGVPPVRRLTQPQVHLPQRALPLPRTQTTGYCFRRRSVFPFLDPPKTGTQGLHSAPASATFFGYPIA